MPPAADLDSSLPRWLRRAFLFAVLAFAWWRFSENTADNDLWGHVLYGQRMLALGGLETEETLSWTAAGRPWTNHEVLAEVALGATHRALGGTGLWLLMVGLAAATVLGAWRAGAGKDRAQSLVAAALLAICTNAIALGYAARPQLFTYAFLVVLLIGLRRFLGGSVTWAALLPLLLGVWVNTHGGFLAGWLAAVVFLGTEFIVSLAPALRDRLHAASFEIKRRYLPLAALCLTAVLLANPWGAHLVTWTLETLRLPRPHLSEWHPLGFGVSALPFYFVLGLGTFAWLRTHRPRRLGEIAVWGMLAAMALLHRRHAPLFGLASVIFLPPHLLDLLRQSSPHLVSLRALAARRSPALALAAALTVAGTACLVASISAPRQFPFRMEVPRNLFPVAAIDFIKTRQLTGNTITFFDWGQQVLWELPDNPVSFDGRLDTVYSAEMMNAHWRLYAGEEPGSVLFVEDATLALLPSDSGGIAWLRQHGWKVIYRDALASVLVRASTALPVTEGGPEAIAGSAPFPDAPPALATRVVR